ncbi:MAG TPA: GTP 3',8-cyclase MoaA, partial [Gammaproteobacteria bacterium]|nr:GTP 3',8-cyclase MoaA [Gammaproteobacteria bacterium]
SILRFIEYMDVGSTNNWKLDEVVSASELVATINQEMPIEPLSPNYRGEVAKRWRYVDDGGEIGFITSVTESFCGDCSRVRLSAVGQIYTCLFATEGFDIRDPLRAGASDQDLLEIVQTLWGKREDRYSELRGQIPVDVFSDAKVEMSHIGG